MFSLINHKIINDSISRSFLIENDYVTTKSVDAVSHNKLYTYFMVEFDWILETANYYFNMNDLVLKSKDKKLGINYVILLNFQDNDYDTLLNIK